MDALSYVITTILMFIGLGIGVSNVVADMTTESTLEYCKRTTHQWNLDECIDTEIRYRAGELLPLSE